jgi:hypothetical protein
MMTRPTEDFFCRTTAFRSITTGRQKTGASFASVINERI